MRDGAIRRGIKAFARLRYAIDLGLTRRIHARRAPLRYRLTGMCNGCGRCCERPTIQVSAWTLRFPLWRALVLAWHRWVNGFVFVEEDRPRGLIAFRCTHYDPATKLCDSYESRPGMCRDYPRPLLEAAVPEFFSECGYSAVDTQAEGLRAALDMVPLDEARRAELYRRLRIKE